MSTKTRWGYIVKENLLNEVTVPRESDGLELAVSQMQVATNVANPVLMAEDSAEDYMDNLAKNTVINSHKQIIGDVVVADYAAAQSLVTSYNNGGTITLDNGATYNKTIAVEGDIINFVVTSGELEEGYVLKSGDMNLSQNNLKDARLDTLEANDATHETAIADLTEKETHNVKKENTVDVVSLGPINPLLASVSDPDKLPTREDIRSAGNAGYQEVLANKALIDVNTKGIADNLSDIHSGRTAITALDTQVTALDGLVKTTSTEVAQHTTEIADNKAQITSNKNGVDDWETTKPRVALLTDIGGVITLTGDQSDYDQGQLRRYKMINSANPLYHVPDMIGTRLHIGIDGETELVLKNKTTVIITRKSSAPIDPSLPDSIHVDLPTLTEYTNQNAINRDTQMGYMGTSNTFNFEGRTIKIGCSHDNGTHEMIIYFFQLGNAISAPDLAIAQELIDNYYVSEWEQKNIKNLGLDQTARDDAAKAKAEATAASVKASAADTTSTKNEQLLGNATSGIVKDVADNHSLAQSAVTTNTTQDIQISNNTSGIATNTSALSAKQDKVDPSLSATTKSVVGAINEVHTRSKNNETDIAELNTGTFDFKGDGTKITKIFNADGDLFTNNANYLVQNWAGVAPSGEADIGKAFLGTQSYGDSAVGPQYYGFSAKSTVSIANAAAGVLEVGKSMTADQFYGHQATKYIWIGSGASGSVSMMSDATGGLDMGSRKWTGGDSKGRLLHGNSTATFEQIIKAALGTRIQYHKGQILSFNNTPGGHFSNTSMFDVISMKDGYPLLGSATSGTVTTTTGDIKSHNHLNGFRSDSNDDAAFIYSHSSASSGAQANWNTATTGSRTYPTASTGTTTGNMPAGHKAIYYAYIAKRDITFAEME